MPLKRLSAYRYRMGAFLLFGLYTVALIKVLLIRNGSCTPFWTVPHALQNVNFIPFHTIMEYAAEARQKGWSGLWQMLANLLGNILLFVPMGYLLPILSLRCRNLWRVTLISAYCSLSVEILQFLFQVGHSDVDDFLLNTLGGLCGWLLLRRLVPLLPLKRKGFLRLAGVTALLFSTGWVVAALLYRHLFGVSL